jgi:hypothetical protein
MSQPWSILQKGERKKKGGSGEGCKEMVERRREN